MKSRNDFLRFLIAGFASVGFLAFGATPTTTADEVKQDNSGVNQRDRRAHELTSGQQGGNVSDTNLTASIRKALMKDDLLSTYAHNVKIITQNGRVTLKGPVRSDAEKTKVESAANRVAGVKNVTSELEIAPQRATR